MQRLNKGTDMLRSNRCAATRDNRAIAAFLELEVKFGHQHSWDGEYNPEEDGRAFLDDTVII